MKSNIHLVLSFFSGTMLVSALTIAQGLSAGNSSTGNKHSLLIILCHADDFISIAPLIPKYAAEGHSVNYLALTGKMDSSEMVNGGSKYAQMLCATTALGFQQVTAFADPNDEGMRSVAWNGRLIIEAINRVKPDVIITWGPDGLTGNMRHVLVGNIVTRVFQQQRLLKHKPRKLYYITYPESLLPDDRTPIGVMAAGSNANNSEAGPFGTISDDFITTVIDGKNYLKQTRAALACLTFPKRAENMIWQEEWYKRLATTLSGNVYLRLVYPVSEGKETDIFKGL
jgi:LmbE family N-acetylglucosaminyl deacetylase